MESREDLEKTKSTPMFGGMGICRRTNCPARGKGCYTNIPEPSWVQFYEIKNGQPNLHSSANPRILIRIAVACSFVFVRAVRTPGGDEQMRTRKVLPLEWLVVGALLLPSSLVFPGYGLDDQQTTAQSNATSISPTMPGVKPGSIDDVNAVGARDIGGRGMGNWYSTESEIRMGKSYATQLAKTVKFVKDPVVVEYVNRITQNLVNNSDAKVPFTIQVIDSDEVNAMALPGGFMFVNSGLILTADDEAEMAGVLAHEIAHVAAHHAVREQTRMNYAQLGSIPLIFVGGWAAYGMYEAAQLGIPLTFLHFSRGFEGQADFLGVQYMYRAGYDPQAMVTIFEKLENLQKPDRT